jgi:hypothetical protein
MRTLFILFLLVVSSVPAGAEPTRSPSPLKEALFSLVLPGSGQLRMESHGKAYAFIAAEALSWMSFFGLNFYGHSIETDARIYGYAHAGADYRRTDEAYWSAVELTLSREAYLEELRRVARSLYPDDPEAQAEYVEDNAVAGDWQWTSNSEWFDFGSMRRSARVVFSRADLVLGVVALNHLVSAVDAFLTARGLKEGPLEGVSLDVHFDPTGDFRAGILKAF